MQIIYLFRVFAGPNAHQSNTLRAQTVAVHTAAEWPRDRETVGEGERVCVWKKTWNKM